MYLSLAFSSAFTSRKCTFEPLFNATFLPLRSAIVLIGESSGTKTPSVSGNAIFGWPRRTIFRSVPHVSAARTRTIGNPASSNDATTRSATTSRNE